MKVKNFLLSRTSFSKKKTYNFIRSSKCWLHGPQMSRFEPRTGYVTSVWEATSRWNEEGVTGSDVSVCRSCAQFPQLSRSDLPDARSRYSLYSSQRSARPPATSEQCFDLHWVFSLITPQIVTYGSQKSLSNMSFVAESLYLRQVNAWTWSHNRKKQTNSLAWVCQQTIPTERPPLVDEVSTNVCG
jgi:hypothetical protein